jgi:hypothetical protein
MVYKIFYLLNTIGLLLLLAMHKIIFGRYRRIVSTGPYRLSMASRSEQNKRNHMVQNNRYNTWRPALVTALRCRTFVANTARARGPSTVAV